MRTTTVVLDSTSFEVPALNLDQLERITPLLQAGSGFGTLKVALERAVPKPKLEELAPTLEEIADAISKVLVLSGLQQPDPNPPQAAS